MSQNSSIEWTDATWNPTRGCSRVSEGCRNCYAERIAARFTGEDGREEKYATFKGFATRVNGHPAWTGKVELIVDKLDEPLHWRKPRRVFVNSMSDLFHENLPDSAIDRVWHTMLDAPQHTYQILTKRSRRMLDYLTSDTVGGKAHYRNAPDWIWLGISVEDQETADARIPELLQTPAAIRFVSYEPALGPVDFWGARYKLGGAQVSAFNWGKGVKWIIVGGESGAGARPFDIQWARNTIRDCKGAAACFVKQLGAKPEGPQGCGDCDPCIYGQPCMLAYNVGLKLKDRKGGDMSEWPADLRVREFPEVTA